MSEAAQLAKAAREHLAAALKALQSSTDVPDELLDAAEPIAEAMSVLHRVERTDGANLEGRDLALINVRKALEKLQQVSQDHPATEVVMEAVASSLSKVHALARYTPPAAAAPLASPQPIPGPPAVQQVPVAIAPSPVMTQAVAQPQPASPPRSAAVPAQNPPAIGPQGTLIQLDGAKSPFASANYPPAPAPQAQAQARPQSQPQAYAPQQPIAAESYAPNTHPQQAQPAYAQPAAQPAYAQPAAQQGYPPPAAQPAYAQPAAQQGYPPPAAQPAYAQPAAQPVQAPQPVQAQQPQAPAYTPPQAPAPKPHSTATTAPATPNAGRIDVELGIHSASNFYKGLGGNDVLDAGGIFVATYKPLKIGASVNLRVLLPGNYEFNAIAVVQWTRAAGDGSEPGFGARFTQIEPEGQKLVHRYARNREPMFYDDL